MASNLKYDDILWDWNGTILNDIDACIGAVNISLEEHNLPIMTRKRYYEMFSFPVENYYKRIGFDLEKHSYNKLAKEYIANYVSEAKKTATVHKGAKEMMEHFESLGLKQTILSASEKEILLERLRHYKLEHYFYDIMALDNVLAVSKIHLGKNWIEKRGHNKRALIIGDTIHDYDVAMEMGIDCILFNGGHGRKDDLTKLGITVVDELESIKDYIYE